MAEAERGYRQILDVEPKNADAIHRFGQLLVAKGDQVAAKRLFKTLTEIRSNTYKSWLCFGQSCEALGQYLEAANAYREVIKLRPDLPDVFSNLGKMLVKLGRIEELNLALVAVLNRESREANPPARNGRKMRGAVEHATSQHEAPSL